MIGGQGEKKTLRLMAEHAEMANFTSGFDELPRKLEVLAGHCADVGRDLGHDQQDVAAARSSSATTIEEAVAKVATAACAPMGLDWDSARRGDPGAMVGARFVVGDADAVGERVPGARRPRPRRRHVQHARRRPRRPRPSPAPSSVAQGRGRADLRSRRPQPGDRADGHRASSAARSCRRWSGWRSHHGAASTAVCRGRPPRWPGSSRALARPVGLISVPRPQVDVLAADGCEQRLTADDRRPDVGRASTGGAWARRRRGGPTRRGGGRRRGRPSPPAARGGPRRRSGALDGRRELAGDAPVLVGGLPIRARR